MTLFIKHHPFWIMTMTMKVRLLSKLYKNKKTYNQQCKYMIHHKAYRQMVKHSRVGHNLDKGGGSGDLCAALY